MIALKVSGNLGNVFGDSIDRYIKTPAESGRYEQYFLAIPAGIIATTYRSFHAVIAGAVDQELTVPDGTFGETQRDIGSVKNDLLPPRPLRLLADAVRVPGDLTTGLIDAVAGTDSRHGD